MAVANGGEVRPTQLYKFEGIFLISLSLNTSVASSASWASWVAMFQHTIKFIEKKNLSINSTILNYNVQKQLHAAWHFRNCPEFSYSSNLMSRKFSLETRLGIFNMVNGNVIAFASRWCEHRLRSNFFIPRNFREERGEICSRDANNQYEYRAVSSSNISSRF